MQKNLPRRSEFARLVSRYLWRGSVDFKKKSRPFFILFLKLRNGNLKTRDFSPLIERVLTGVWCHVAQFAAVCSFRAKLWRVFLKPIWLRILFCNVHCKVCRPGGSKPNYCGFASLQYPLKPKKIWSLMNIFLICFLRTKKNIGLKVHLFLHLMSLSDKHIWQLLFPPGLLHIL